MLQVDEAKQRVTVHYTGWHKRYDFSCDMTSQRIRRCPDGVDFKPGCAVPMVGACQPELCSALVILTPHLLYTPERRSPATEGAQVG